jgi:DNA replication protein DnaC
MTTPDLRKRADSLGLYGLLLHWDEIREADWLPWLLEVEEDERQRRSLERRIRNGKLGRFKPMADFDWAWPETIDRVQVEALLRLEFIKDAANPIVIGPNGIGKTMLAKNVAHKALLAGNTVLFTTASDMLGDLAAQDSASGLKRRLARYTRPRLLVVDEVGYLSYGNRHADLLFEVVTRRYSEGGKPIMVTTNKPFGEWGEVFPNASCVVTLVDRLVHRSEIIKVAGESYRLKEAKDRAASKAEKRGAKPGGGER